AQNLSRSLDTSDIWHAEIHQNYIWSAFRRLAHCLFSVCRFSYHLNFWQQIQQDSQPVTEDRMVVRNEQAYRFHRMSSFCNGRQTCTQVPPVVLASMVQIPPSSAARSRIEERPIPVRRCAGKPHPSSQISRERMSPQVSFTMQD